MAALDWNTRLEITANDEVICPIDSFTPTFNTPVDVIHSIEDENVGFTFKPRTATFSMQVKAIGPSVAQLTKLALAGERFDIQLAEKSGTDWSFKKLLFRECLITQANPSNVTAVDGEPVATFSGSILGFTADTDIEE